MKDKVVPASVLAAFGLQGAQTPLAGGQGTSVLVDGVVLKAGYEDGEAAWVAELVGGLVQEGFRAPKPRRALDGRWNVEHWSAWELLPGAWDTSKPHEILAATRALERALAGKAAPAWLNEREHPWGVADRMVWGEQAFYEDEALMAPIRSLCAKLRPVALPLQLVHQDVAGNILFAEGAAPGIIDYSLYQRPQGYGVAVAAVDLVDWFGAPQSLFDEVLALPEGLQLLLHAELFRVLVYGGFGLKGDALEKRMKDHRATLGWLRERFGVR